MPSYPLQNWYNMAVRGGGGGRVGCARTCSAIEVEGIGLEGWALGFAVTAVPFSYRRYARELVSKFAPVRTCLHKPLMSLFLFRLLSTA